MIKDPQNPNRRDGDRGGTEPYKGGMARLHSLFPTADSLLELSPEALAPILLRLAQLMPARLDRNRPHKERTMSVGSLSQIFSWLTIGLTLLAALTSGIALHYRNRAAADAEAQGKIEVSALQKQLSEADKLVAGLQKFQAQRGLTDEQKQTLVAAISPFKGTPVAVGSLFGDDDGKRYRDDFAEVLNKAEWNLEGRVGEMNIDSDPVGVAVAMDKAWVQAGNQVPDAVTALIVALFDMKIISAKKLTLIANFPPGRIVLVIGKKPR